MAKEKKEKEQGEGKKFNPILFILIAVVLIAGSAGGMFLFMSGKTAAKEAIVETKVVVSQDLTVNLSDAERYLKTTVCISYDEKNSKLGDEITAKTVEIQDATSMYLQSKSAKDFDANNEANLKNGLADKINALLTKGKIVNIYFPNGLLVQ